MANERPSMTPIPDYLQALLSELPANLRSGVSVPTLSFQGGVWQMRDGNDVKRYTVKIDNTDVAVPFIDVIIVGRNPDFSRVYYEHPFDPNTPTAPTCAASDGIKPDEDIVEKQSPTCATCKNNVKGSKIATDGVTLTTACGRVQRLAVVPADDIEHKPMLLQFRGWSLFDPDDNESAQQGSYAFSQYKDELVNNKASNLAIAITRISIKSDGRPGVTLRFSLRGWIKREIALRVKEITTSEPVQMLTSGRFYEYMKNQGAGVLTDKREQFAALPAQASTPDVDIQLAVGSAGGALPDSALVKPQFAAQQPAPQPEPPEAKAEPAKAVRNPSPRRMASVKPAAPVDTEGAAPPEADQAAVAPPAEAKPAAVFDQASMDKVVAEAVAKALAAMRGNGAAAAPTAAPNAATPSKPDDSDPLEQVLGDWAKL